MAAGRRPIKDVVAFNAAIDDDRVMEAIRAAEERTTGQIRVHISGRISKDVERSARRRFARLNMGATPDRNAVLIYVQPRTHRFFILGDVAFGELGGSALWEPAAARLSEELKAGRYTEGLVGVVGYAGEVLARHFPAPDGGDAGPGLPDEITGD